MMMCFSPTVYVCSPVRGSSARVAAACRLHGIHRSTFYRWKAMSDRFGLEILRPRERRRPQMPNAIPVLVEHRIIAFALGAPGSGPARIAAELAREKHGGLKVSANGVYRVLRRHGIHTRALRNGLLAGYASPPEPAREPEPERHIAVDHPGELVQMDCFCIGRLAGTKGVVWQYTAIDAASAFTWAELHVTPRNPDVRFAAGSPTGSLATCVTRAGSWSASPPTTAPSSATTSSTRSSPGSAPGTP